MKEHDQTRYIINKLFFAEMDRLSMAAGLKVVSKPDASITKAKTRPLQTDVELGDIRPKDEYFTARSHSLAITPGGPVTPVEARTNPPTGVQTPSTPHGLEANTPPDTEDQRNVAGLVPSFFYPPMNRYRVLCACMTYFVNGMNDSGM